MRFPMIDSVRANYRWGENWASYVHLDTLLAHIGIYEGEISGMGIHDDGY